MISEINFTRVEDQEPPKDESPILAMNFRNGTIFWMASIWYHSDSKTWCCDFTDNEFKNI